MTDTIKSRDCTKCDCGLYELFIDNNDVIVAAECNMCGDRFDTPKPRVLNLNDADHLADIMRGVMVGRKMRIYPSGARDADNPVIVIMRAFTSEGGGLYSSNADIRDAYVWCSGFMERWFSVEWLIKALDNIDGKHGYNEPIAIIDKE